MTRKKKRPNLILKPIVHKKIRHPLLVLSARTRLHCKQSRFPQVCRKPIQVLPSNPLQPAVLLHHGSKQRVVQSRYYYLSFCPSVRVSVYRSIDLSISVSIYGNIVDIYIYIYIYIYIDMCRYTNI